MSREEDYPLVRLLRSSDPEKRESAFDELYLKYKDRVYSLATRVLNDRDLAADALQTTFVAVLRKVRKFKFRSAFSSWLYRVTVNQCIDLRRRRARNPRLSLSEPEVTEQVGHQDRRRELEPGPPDAARQAELRREIQRAIGTLDPRMAAVVILRYMEGLDYLEIAEILDLPLGTVKSRLNRAHAALDVELSPILDDLV